MHLLFLLLFFSTPLLAQYPFEKFPTISKHTVGPWQRYNKEDRIHWTITIPKFYDDSVEMTVQITTLADGDTSLIRIYKGKKQIQIMRESYAIGRAFGFLQDSLSYADINGDSRKDIRLIAWYGGNGVASYNYRMLYLFQRSNGTFDKISYSDKMITWNKERDFNGEGNFEILTTTLDYHEGHSYWTFNVYRFDDGQLRNVNDEFGYPIMIQYLYRENYAITNKITPQKMKDFSRKVPENFSK